MKKIKLFNGKDIYGWDINNVIENPEVYIRKQISDMIDHVQLDRKENDLKRDISYLLQFDVPVLDELNITTENDNNHPNETIHVVPFKGDARCFEYKTNFQSNAYPPNGVIRDKADLLIFVSEEAVSMSQHNSFDEQLKSIKVNLSHLATMTKNFNLILETYCSQLISERKEYLRKN
jgi:hypothetical protein